MRRPTTHRATDPRPVRQTNDTRFDQTANAANVGEKERSDELIFTSQLIFFQDRTQARHNLHATFSPPLARAHLLSCPSPWHRNSPTHTRKRHAHTHALAAHTPSHACSDPVLVACDCTLYTLPPQCVIPPSCVKVSRRSKQPKRPHYATTSAPKEHPKRTHYAT